VKCSRAYLFFSYSIIIYRLRAARHLKAELKRADITYDELANRLARFGFGETKASIANKLARASAHFLLASLAAIRVSHIRLEDV
jgi:hypothetical protein